MLESIAIDEKLSTRKSQEDKFHSSRFTWVFFTYANEHKIFAPGGPFFNGLWAQLADQREQIGLIAGAGWVLLTCYTAKLL